MSVTSALAEKKFVIIPAFSEVSSQHLSLTTLILFNDTLFIRSPVPDQYKYAALTVADGGIFRLAVVINLGLNVLQLSTSASLFSNGFCEAPITVKSTLPFSLKATLSVASSPAGWHCENESTQNSIQTKKVIVILYCLNTCFMLHSINPTNLKTLSSYNDIKSKDVTQLIVKVDKQFSLWRDYSITKRSNLLFVLAELIDKNKNSIAEIATLEMGKPINQAISEVEKCSVLCKYYATQGPSMLEKRTVLSDAKESWVQYEPIGAVLGVMPWNFPFWQVFRFAVPTLMAGNVALLKHASNVPQCGFLIEQLFKKAGFPDNVFTYLPIQSDLVEGIIQHDIVQAVSVTGSNQTGSIIASQAAKEIKKSVLELGGSDAFIVCEDADIEQTIEGAMKGRFQNNGQSCIAAKRFIIHEKIYASFITEFEKRVRSLKVGDPMDKTTDIGPLAKKHFVVELMNQINTSIDQGASLRCGGSAIGAHNQFLLPTILENVRPGMPAFDEELFGPVASCIKVKSDDEALQLSNQSVFGLGASVWTSSRDRALSFVNQIEVGTVSVNKIVSSDPRLPFGGVKKSGYGRELSENGLYEFVNIKTIHIN